ncbi:4-hydroxybenzoate transporter PcaK [Kingella kingae]|uniref:3-isopropylmalate dehydratase n=1 Tax=Kingella kingae TaxID=504 RepID=UPI000DFD9AED|nr:3-isopropylmalate dehydratase [Kingella kingae]MDK4596279.1 3-isopropylmalate dehydratase [Kingella kingae]MDK4600264.1 3-isopropylmalate dehydratase [Kingella kingae]MDK4653959.1 3-isopropylmalate dehydratase [Kingella kingae]STR03814.1 4-hydroxybenzoate transporter PcaK [Kingella kingae]
MSAGCFDYVLMAFTLLSTVAICVFVPVTAILSVALILAILLGALINGCIAGLYTINPTLYNTEFRSTGVSMAIGMGRLGSIISPWLVGTLLDEGWQKKSTVFWRSDCFAVCRSGYCVA